MRARYCAYTIGLADFIIDTTHPDSPHTRPDRDAWRADIQQFCTTTTFERLDVTAAEQEPDTQEAFVTFTARLRQNDQPAPMTERSRFLRHNGRWHYLAAATAP
jgi:SEC-C motif-containing protein